MRQEHTVERSNLKRKTFTEDLVATYLARVNQSRIRFDTTQKTWYYWDGQYWRQDQSRILHIARATCRVLANTVSSEDAKKKLGRLSFISAALTLASSDPNLTVTTHAWDNNPLLLGTPSGVIDLTSGKLLSPNPEHMITKSTGVPPAELADCPRWLQFLHGATGGDTALVEFIKSWLGYCLTALTTEQKLMFLYGPGGNGKGVLLHTVVKIMGDYAKTAPMSTFTAKRFDAHPEELASLQGARLVIASETEFGQALAESRIKELTGGDAISCRHMYGHRFAYEPSFKIMISGNHAPALQAVDAGMRRRPLLCEFNNVPKQPDPYLEAILRNEWPAILRWMIDGCLTWQRNRLNIPATLTSSTEAYFESQDHFGTWLNEDCEFVDEDEYTSSNDLFGSWAFHCEAGGEHPGTFKTFAERMIRATGKRPEQIKKLGKKGYRGIKLKKP